MSPTMCGRTVKPLADKDIPCSHSLLRVPRGAIAGGKLFIGTYPAPCATPKSLKTIATVFILAPFTPTLEAPGNESWHPKEARPKAFAYLRVSGKGQVRGDGFTRQLRAIRAYANQQGIWITQVFREEGVAGR